MREPIVERAAAVRKGTHPIPRLHLVRRSSRKSAGVSNVDLFEFADAPLPRNQVSDIRDARVIQMRRGEGVFHTGIFDERVESACFCGSECQRLFADNMAPELCR